MGGLMAAGARGSPRRLLGLVFLVASAVTAVLSLDATIVLLTPIVFATAARLRTSPRPHVYACSHLANSASQLLPVSNLTNLLAFHASGLSFTRFAGLMALPTPAPSQWNGWCSRASSPSTSGARDVPRRRSKSARRCRASPWPSSPSPSPASRRAPCSDRARVGGGRRGARDHRARARPPRDHAADAGPGRRALLPGLRPRPGRRRARRQRQRPGLRRAGGAARRRTLPELLAVAAVSAILANLVNNLPATLILVPVAAPSGAAAVLAVLVGVNVGPNLTYVGSLATLLWRRVLHVEDHQVELGEFVRLGALTVPAGIVVATVLLWFTAQGLT